MTSFWTMYGGGVVTRFLCRGVIPARDVTDDREAVSSAATMNGTTACIWMLREDDRRPFVLHAASSGGERSAASVMPTKHRRVEGAQGQRSCEQRIEKPVLMARLHAVAVEPSTEAVTEREWVEADPAVEPLSA